MKTGSHRPMNCVDGFGDVCDRCPNVVEAVQSDLEVPLRYAGHLDHQLVGVTDVEQVGAGGDHVVGAEAEDVVDAVADRQQLLDVP